VKLAPEPTLKAAMDVPPPTLRSEPPPDQKLVLTSTPPLVVSSKPAKRGFFQKINPMNLFGGQEKSTGQAQLKQQINLPPADSDSGTVASSMSETSAGSPGRYAYRSPMKPEPGNRSEAEQSFSLGLQAQQAQRLPEAIQAYRQAIQIDPAFFDAYYNL